MLLHGPEPRVDWRPLRSTLAYLQTDTDFASLIVGEVNAGLFSSVLKCRMAPDLCNRPVEGT